MRIPAMLVGMSRVLPLLTTITSCLALLVLRGPALAAETPDPGTPTSGSGLDWGFLQHPYADDKKGFLARRSQEPAARLWALRVQGEYGHTTDDHDLYGLDARLNVSIFYLETRWQRFIARSNDGSADSCSVGTATIGVTILVSPYAAAHVGLGASLFRDEQDTNTTSSIGTSLYQDSDEEGRSGHIGYGIEVYPCKPLSLSLDGGYFKSHGDSPALRQFRAEAGLCLGAGELVGGWQSTIFGDAHLHGPVIGCRWWL